MGAGVGKRGSAHTCIERSIGTRQCLGRGSSSVDGTQVEGTKVALVMEGVAISNNLV